MVLVLKGVPVDHGNCSLIALVFALTCGLAIGFIGGDAAMRGHLLGASLPLGVKRHPMRVAASGGIAAILIAFLITKPAICPDTTPRSPLDFTLAEATWSDRKLVVSADIVYGREDFGADHELQASMLPTFTELAGHDYIVLEEGKTSVSAHVAVGGANPRGGSIWVRTVVRNHDGRRLPNPTPKEIRYGAR